MTIYMQIVDTIKNAEEKHERWNESFHGMHQGAKTR
jgi:hypothetical protein